MIGSRKMSSRRSEIRKNRPDTTDKWLAKARADGRLVSVWIAIGFFAVASAIAMLRENVVPYRPGQWAPHDIVSRVDFTSFDPKRLTKAQEERREKEPRVYTSNVDVWGDLETYLTSLPDRVTGNSYSQLSEKLRN